MRAPPDAWDPGRTETSIVSQIQPQTRALRLLALGRTSRATPNGVRFSPRPRRLTSGPPPSAASKCTPEDSERKADAVKESGAGRCLVRRAQTTSVPSK
jgi:hypothetical protein